MLTVKILNLAGSRNPGLAVMMITLLVIIMCGGILIRSELQEHEREMQENGTMLTRILADMPRQQLVASHNIGGLIQLLKSYSSGNALAYVVVTDEQGAIVNQMVSHDIDPPAIDEYESRWLSQHTLWVGDVEILEFRAPVLDDQQRIVGYIRTGYIAPELRLPLFKDISLMAQIALPIFLLVPVFFFFLARSQQPLRDANLQIQQLIGEQSSDGNPPAEFGEFVQNFNDFILTAREQLGDLETQKLKALTSNKILNYHKRRVESTLHTIPDAIVVIDESGTATFANNRVKSLIGLAPDDIMGKPTMQWCTNSGLAVLLSKYHVNITSIKREQGIEFCPEHNLSKTVSGRVYPLFSPKDSSTVLGILLVLSDISAEVMARKSRDEFVAHVSHELKSPLNVISLRSELIVDLVSDESGHLIENINIIQNEVERLNTLISDLLNITQIETGSVALNRKRVKLKELLEDVHESFLSPAGQKNITLELDLPQNLSTMNLDKELMRVAINNLLTNAIKYSDSDASVSIVAEESHEEITIKVIDNGIGISTDDQKHVFDKFYRSESENVQDRQGHGLGLSLAHEIITLHHGELKVDSTIGEGTTFCIQLAKTSTLLKQAGQA